MPHRRRQQDAAHAFAWPPTREDLDLIEIVDPDTLRPVNAQYNDPEPGPVQLDLLKSVTPVRPVRTPLPTPVSQLDTPPAPAPLVLVYPPQPPASTWIQTQAHTQALARTTVPGMLPFPRRRLDRSWLIAACGFGAIALSAYFSLHPAPSPATIDAAASSPVVAASVPRLTARPLSSIELSWWPAASPPAQIPPSQVASAKPESPASDPKPAPGPATFQRTRSFGNRESRDASAKPSTPAQTIDSIARHPAGAPPTSASLATNLHAPGTPTASAATSASLATNLHAPATAARSTSLATNAPAPATAAPPSPAPNLRTPAAAAPSAAPETTMAALNPLDTSSVATGGMAHPAALVSAPKLDLAPPPGPAATTPPAAVKAPVDLGEAMQQQIYAALHQYERGYERLDASAVRAVWPSVDARALARAFHDLKSQTLVFDRCDIDVARIQAVAACRGRATYETRVGDQALRTEPREWTFKLRKSDEAWQIVSANAR